MAKLVCVPIGRTWEGKKKKNPDIIILTHVNVVSLTFKPLPLFNLTTRKDFPAETQCKKKPQKNNQTSVYKEKSRAGPSLVQTSGLAQRLWCCSKAPVHASETPLFMCWLAGASQPPSSNTAHQITVEHYHTQVLKDSKFICWFQFFLESNFFLLIQDSWNKDKILWRLHKANLCQITWQYLEDVYFVNYIRASIKSFVF